MKTLPEMGFEPLGFRFVKHFRIDTYEELNSEDARNIPLHDMFDLFVDPVVDHIHPEVRTVFGFVPIDEPLLDRVFVGHKYRLSEPFGTKGLLPLPDVLLATKLRSVTQRDKVHKRIKDIADIFALSWYSDEKLPGLREALARMIPSHETRTIVDSFTGEDLSAVSSALGIETHQIQRVLSELRYP